jgi:poly-gamma-glutamate synthesis protein (capsule biosynthesis protein)
VAEESDKSGKKVQKVSKAVNRRKMLGGSAFAVGGLAAAAQLLRPSKAKAATPGGKGDFTVCAVGEGMASRPFSMVTDPQLTGICKLLRDADVSYAHSEMNYASDDEITWTPRGTSGVAGYLFADPQVLKDMKWAGIDVMSQAQNHSFDWGPEGIRATMKHYDETGVAYAGIGMDLEEARSPRYFDTAKHRMAIVSVASGNNAYEWAGLAKGKTPGRPGVNPIRVTTVYEVPKANADQLKATARGLGIMNAAAAARPQFTMGGGGAVGGTGVVPAVYRESDKFNVTSEAHPGDIMRNLRSIKEARTMSDFVMVAHHNSTSESGRGTTPSAFVVDFARKAIDAGADAYFGHGWHTFLGIEVYKGKPIFYGMGSFFWQSQFIERIPADSYESYQVDLDKLGAANPAIGNLHPEGSDDWGWSAVYQCKYVGGKLVEIALYPIEMGIDFSGEKPVRTRLIGQGETKYLDGSPRLAVGANGQAILKKLQDVNRLRGTTMVINGNVGRIKVSAV